MLEGKMILQLLLSKNDDVMSCDEYDMCLVELRLIKSDTIEISMDKSLCSLGPRYYCSS